MQVIVVETYAGTVQYTTADGYIGVRIEGEGTRVDEWHPSQVRGDLKYGEWETYKLSR